MVNGKDAMIFVKKSELRQLIGSNMYNALMRKNNRGRYQNNRRSIRYWIEKIISRFIALLEEYKKKYLY